MLKHREVIRDSKHLNKLLFDNLHGLKFIFEKGKNGGKNFTLECALKLFGIIDHPEFVI